MSKAQLYQKIHKVMQDIEYLQKDDSVEFKSTKYKAISEEKVTSTVRASLIKNGLIILPVEQAHKREETLTTVDTRYKIIDIETGEFETIVSSGTGVDTQDKGVGKAMTYSYKYLLLRSFAIPTGDDPDKVSSAELDEEEKQKRLAVIKAKYETFRGTEDGFDEFMSNCYKNNWNDKRIEQYLTQKIAEKNKGA